ncbi:MAG: 4-hydroxy-tetrahydrodipicolinate reductase [Chitinophagales bacterium]|nr:4-hydroxy-tetrahydrodipicolinate reductase [Chitinophagales bacterium]
MTKIALIGYGKMGKAIHEIANASNDCEIALIIDIDNRNEITIEQLQAVDVAIEFTSPHTAVGNINWCLDANVPVVIGSTGWLDELPIIQERVINENKSLLHSPNFSIGVNIFFEMNRQLAKIMNQHAEYNVTMEEIHHTEKKDAPSGTALFAGLDIIKHLDRKMTWKNEQSNDTNNLDIISLREPNVPGTHTVIYASEIDDIELKHTAHSRKGFASGALLAAKWLVGKKGIFTMDDVLGFNSK